MSRNPVLCDAEAKITKAINDSIFSLYVIQVHGYHTAYNTLNKSLCKKGSRDSHAALTKVLRILLAKNIIHRI
jgi:hypothetical protein